MTLHPLISLAISFPFYDFILPTFFGISALNGRPRLARWHAMMQKESDAATNEYRVVWAGLEKWWDNGRWEKLGMTPVSNKPICPF
jgi:hypothetical protein